MLAVMIILLELFFLGYKIECCFSVLLAVMNVTYSKVDYVAKCPSKT